MKDFFDTSKFNSSALCCIMTSQGGGTPNWFVVPTIVTPSGHITYPDARMPENCIYAISLTTCKVSSTILYGKDVVVPYSILEPIVNRARKFDREEVSFHDLTNFLDKASVMLSSESIGSLERIITGASEDTLLFFHSIKKTMSVASIPKFT